MRLLASTAVVSTLLLAPHFGYAAPKSAVSARVERQRGELISVVPLGTMPTSDLKRIAAEFPGGISAQGGAGLVWVEYWTVLKGPRARASGLLVGPQAATPVKGVVLFLHGTNATRATAPSQPGRVDGNEEAAVFAGNGYIVALPDYLGLGVSRAPHPYLIVQPQVDASIDMLRAVQQASAVLRKQSSAKLFMMGFSQGGQVVAAVHRALDRRPVSGFRLRGSIGIAGPYNLLEASLPKAVENNCLL